MQGKQGSRGAGKQGSRGATEQEPRRVQGQGYCGSRVIPRQKS